MALHELLVRLGLQAKEFQDGIKNVTADLKQVEKNTQNTTTVMKAAWRDLGIKSSEYIEAKKVSITKAYETIRASGVYSAQEVLRAEQAKNVKLKALDEQQFGNQTSLLTSMKTHWMAYSASAYAALAIVQKGWALAEESAGYIEQMQLLDALAKKYNTSATIIVGKIREVGEGMISMSTASQIGLSGLAKGLNPEMLYGLAKAAVVLSDTMGVTANEAFKQMAEALEANKMKALKLAVGTIDLKEKYGDLADKMTEAEKQAALYNIIMDKTAEIQGQTGDTTKSLSDQMETFRVRIADLRIEMGIYLIKAGAGVIGMFQGMYSAGLLAAAGIWKIDEAYNRLRAVFSWGEVKKEFLAAADIAASMATENWKMSGKAATDAQQNLKLMTTSTKGLIEAEKSRGSVVNSVTDSVRKQEDANKAAIKAAKEAEQAYSKMYGSMKFEAAGYVDYAKKKLEEERDNFIKTTGNKTLANQWYWTELNKLYHEQLYGLTQLEKEQAQDSIKVAKDKLTELKKFFDPLEWKKISDTIGKSFIGDFGGVLPEVKIFHSIDKTLFQRLNELIGGTEKAGQGFIGQIDRAGNITIRAAGNLGTAITAAGKLFGMQTFAAGLNVATAWGQVIKGIADIIAQMLDLPRQIIEAITNVFNLIGNFSDVMIKAINGLIDSIINAVSNVGKILSELLPRLIKAVPDIIEGVLNSIPILIQTIIGSIPLIIDALIGSIPRIIAAIIESVPKIAEVTGQSILDLPGQILESVGDIFGFHQGGIIKAHQGLYVHPAITEFAKSPIYAHRGLSLASDERLIVAQTGEGILPRSSMQKMGSNTFESLRTGEFGRSNDKGNTQPIVVNVYLDGEKIQRSIYRTTKYGEPIIYEGGITNR